MKAKLQKLSANKDRQDSIQFQMDKAQVEEFQEELIALRRYDNVNVEYESQQSAINLDPEKTSTHFPSFKFQATNISISCCVLEDGWVVTLTLSFEDPKVFDHVVTHKLRNEIMKLTFTEGDNPYSQ